MHEINANNLQNNLLLTESLDDLEELFGNISEFKIKAKAKAKKEVLN